MNPTTKQTPRCEVCQPTRKFKIKKELIDHITLIHGYGKAIAQAESGEVK